jgi:hypothetical protein
MKGAFILFIAFAATGVQARPFKELCERFEPVRKLSGLKYVKAQIKVEPKRQGVESQDVRFTIEAKSGTIRVVPRPDGAVEFPFTDELCAENPDIEVNQPAGTLSLGISVDPRIPPVRTFDYRLLESMRSEWNEAIARQGVLWRALAPASKAYRIVFEPGVRASAEIRLPSGMKKIAADAQGQLRIPFDDSWVAANPTIVLSAMPKKIGLVFE